jgi:hypothetical protein
MWLAGNIAGRHGGWVKVVSNFIHWRIGASSLQDMVCRLLEKFLSRSVVVEVGINDASKLAHQALVHSRQCCELL